MPGTSETASADAIEKEVSDQTAMEAAFAAATGATEVAQPEKTAPVTETTPEPAPELKAAEPAEVKTETPTPEPAPAAQLTADQLALLATIPELEKRLTQQVDKVSGNYGEVKRLLESVKKAAATPEGAADAADEWGQLSAEFGPELAQGITKGVSASVEKALQRALTAMPQMSPEAIKEIVAAEREAERARRVATDIALLDKAHPDRFEIQKSTDWSAWLETLSPIRREKILTTYDLEYVSDRLDDFKAFRTAKQKEKQKSTSRIEAAVAPTGATKSGRTTLSEAEEMHQAFLAAANSA